MRQQGGVTGKRERTCAWGMNAFKLAEIGGPATREVPRVRVDLVGSLRVAPEAVAEAASEAVAVAVAEAEAEAEGAPGGEEVAVGTPVVEEVRSRGDDGGVGEVRRAGGGGQGIRLAIEVEDMEQLVRRAFERALGGAGAVVSGEASFFEVGGDVAKVLALMEGMKEGVLGDLGCGGMPLGAFLKVPTSRAAALYLYERQRHGSEARGDEAVEAEARRVLRPLMESDGEWDVGLSPGAQRGGSAGLPGPVATDVGEAEMPKAGQAGAWRVDGVLVTGASSVVGSQALLRLLGISGGGEDGARRRRGPVWVLVRRGGNHGDEGGMEEAMDRLMRRLRERRLVAEQGARALEEAAAQGWLCAVYGDLGAPHLGLAPKEFNRMADGCRVILHAATRVNQLLPYGSLRACSVVGVRELVRLACSPWRSASMGFVHVGVDTSLSARVACEDHLHVSREPWQIEGGYAQCRSVAECFLQQAARRGLRVSALRAENLGPSIAAGRVHDEDIRVSILAVSIHIGALPTDWELRWSPADECVRHAVGAVDALLGSGTVEDTLVGTCTLPVVTATGNAIQVALLKAASLDLKLLPTSEWMARLHQLHAHLQPGKRLHWHVAELVAVVAAYGVDHALDVGASRTEDVAFSDAHLPLIRIALDRALHDISSDGGIHVMKAMDPMLNASPQYRELSGRAAAGGGAITLVLDAEDLGLDSTAGGPEGESASAGGGEPTLVTPLRTAKADSATEALESERAAKADLEGRVDSLTGELEVALNAIRSLGVVNSGLESDVDAFKSQAQSLSVEVKRLESLRGDMLIEVNALRAEVEEANRSLGGLAVREETLKEDLGDLANRFRDLQASKDAVEAAQLSTDAKNEFLRTQLETYRKQASEHKRAKDELAAYNDSLVAKFEPAIASAEAEIVRLKRKLSESDMRYEALRAEAASNDEAHRTQVLALTAELDGLKVAKGAVEVELAAAKSDLSAADVEVSAARAELALRMESDAKYEEGWQAMRAEQEEFDLARNEFVFVKRTLERDISELRRALESEESELWKEIERLRAALAAAEACNGATYAVGQAEGVREATTATSGAPLAWPVSASPQPPTAHESPSESILYRPTFHAREFVDSAVKYF